MTNFEYFMWLLKGNEEILDKLNDMEQVVVDLLVKSFCGSVEHYYKLYGKGE